MSTTQARAREFLTIFLNSEYMQVRAFGSSSDAWYHDPERMSRCAAAAENGEDGSTHEERIQDYREGFHDWLRDRKKNPDSAGYVRFERAVDQYLDDLDAYHATEGAI